MAAGDGRQGGGLVAGRGRRGVLRVEGRVEGRESPRVDVCQAPPVDAPELRGSWPTSVRNRGGGDPPA